MTRALHRELLARDRRRRRARPHRRGDVGPGRRRAPDSRTALVEGTASTDCRRWTYAELLADAEQCRACAAGPVRAGRTCRGVGPQHPRMGDPGVRRSALAGLVLVTVNPAFLVGEVAYVLGKSRAVGDPVDAGVPRQPDGCDARRRVARSPRSPRGVSLEEFDEFVADRRRRPRRCPDVAPRRSGPDPVHVGNHRLPQGRAPAPPRAGQQRAVHRSARQRAGARGVVSTPCRMFHTGGLRGWARSVRPRVRARRCSDSHGTRLCTLELIEQERAHGDAAGAHDADRAHGPPRLRDAATSSSLSAVLSGGALVPAELVRRIEDDAGRDASRSSSARPSARR